MPLICQGHAKVDSILISILDNKYLLLAPPSGRILRKKGKSEWVPFFRLTGGTPERKVPADRRGQQGLVKEREQQAFSRVKSKSLQRWCVSGLPLQPEFSPGRRSAPEGEEFPGACEAGGQPGQRSAAAKILAAGLEIFPGMRSTVDRAMWGRRGSRWDQFRKGMNQIAQLFFTMSTFSCHGRR